MIGDVYTVDPQREWDIFRAGKVETWTVDGAPLAAVRFVTGLDQDESLFVASWLKRGSEPPKFKSFMTTAELMTFVVDSLNLVRGVREVRGSNLQVRPFGGLEGFAFDLTYLFENGLEGAGAVVGVMKDRKLQLIMYTGARMHYFPKYRADVDRIIDSIQMR
jgi:hypothetical protein